MALSKLGYQANCWGPLGGDAVGVTSIKDLYYRTFADMSRAFADIGEAGYQGVEIFDGNLVDYADRSSDLARQLANAGLTLVAVYSGGNFIFPDILDEELWRIERVAGLAAIAGALHLVVGGGAKSSAGAADDDYKRLAEALDRVVAIAEKHGMSAQYHPHLTTIVETPEQVARILSLSRIQFCPDTGHLAAGGGDPARLIADHFDRIGYVHLKGLQREPFAFTPIDRGDVDLSGVVGLLEKRSFEGWVTVELDAWDDPKAAAAQSRRFLNHTSR